MEGLIKPKVERTFSLLLANYNKSLTIKAISEAQAIPYTTVFEIMNNLVIRHIVKKEKMGKAHTYRINLKSKTTKALLNMANTLRLTRAQINIDLPKDIKVDFLILYNGKKVGVTRNLQSYELKGYDFITSTALKNTLQKKPNLLNSITVPIGFDKYYAFLRELEDSIVVRKSKTAGIDKLEAKLNETLELLGVHIKKKQYALAVETMYDAIRFNTKIVGLKKGVKVNGHYYDYLRKVLVKDAELISNVEKGFKKMSASTKITASNVATQFKYVETLLGKINDVS